MKVFLTGATGYIGGAVASALQARGYSVSGSARTLETEQKLLDRGITPVLSDLKSPKSLIQGAESADAVIHAGTTRSGREDGDAIETMLEAIHGTGKTFIFTSGVWVLGNTGDTPATEEAPVHPPGLVAWRPAVEKLVCQSRGMRGLVVRPAVVYGYGAGIPSLFVQWANETGRPRYIGSGENRWSAVHLDDLATLYLLALEKASAGTIFHGADGSAFRMREIAEAAAFGAGVEGHAFSWPVVEAETKLGAFYVEALLLDQVISGDKARRELGWQPRAVSLVEDLRRGSYAVTPSRP